MPSVQVTYLPVQQNGLVDLQQLEDAFRPDTAIVSVMMVNNEIGARGAAMTSRTCCVRTWVVTLLC